MSALFDHADHASASAFARFSITLIFPQPLPFKLHEADLVQPQNPLTQCAHSRLVSTVDVAFRSPPHSVLTWYLDPHRLIAILSRTMTLCGSHTLHGTLWSQSGLVHGPFLKWKHPSPNLIFSTCRPSCLIRNARCCLVSSSMISSSEPATHTSGAGGFSAGSGVTGPGTSPVGVMKPGCPICCCSCLACPWVSSLLASACSSPGRLTDSPAG